MSTELILLTAGIAAVVLPVIVFYLKKRKATRMLKLRDEAERTSSKKPEQKFALYKRALALYPDNLTTLNGFAVSYIKAKQIDESEKLVARGLKLAQKQQDRRWSGSFQIFLADIHFLRGDLETAEKICNEVLTLVDNLPDVTIATTRKDKASWYENAQTTLKLIRYGKTPDDDWMLDYLIRDCSDVIEKVAYKYLDAGNLEPAKRNFYTALEIAEKENNPTRIGIATEGLGDVFFQQANFAEAAKYYNKSLSINSQSGNEIAKAIILGRLGNVYYKSGSFDEAREHLTEAIDIKKKNGFQYAGDLNNLSLVYKETGDLEKAAEYAGEALEYFRSNNKQAGIANSLLQLGGIALKAKSLVQASQYYEEARILIEKSDDRYRLAAVIGNLGLVAKEQKDLGRAENYLKESLKICQEGGYHEFTANQLSYLGELAAEQSMSASACDFWKQSRDVYLNIGLHHKVSEVEALMSEAGCS